MLITYYLTECSLTLNVKVQMLRGDKSREKHPLTTARWDDDDTDDENT